VRLQPWWYSRTPVEPGAPLGHRVTADVVVVGGGVAGLHAALRLNAEGARVVLLEKTFCGGGMSGLSSGFLTPDSEMGLRELVQRFGVARASALWAIAWDGVRLIASTARAHAFECDLCECDCLFVGDGSGGAAAVRAEDQAHRDAGYQAVRYDQDALATVHPGGYAGGLRYSGTWTIDPFAYCRALRTLLVGRGVQVYENTEVSALDGTTAVTSHGAATGGYVVWCGNQLSPQISQRGYRQYSIAQTCLRISEPLSKDQIAALFPVARLQCWDSDLIYNYYRLTGDDRLLLGGGSLWMAVAGRATPAEAAAIAGIAEFKRRFPAVDDVEFSAYWPGLIDVTRDLMPVADADPDRPHIFFIFGCAGLPWAAWCGDHIAGRIGGAATTDVASLLRWNRRPFIPDALQNVLGKPASFALDFLAIKRGARYRE
jgi:gamma-glutamylputrescine oxidase